IRKDQRCGVLPFFRVGRDIGDEIAIFVAIKRVELAAMLAFIRSCSRGCAQREPKCRKKDKPATMRIHRLLLDQLSASHDSCRKPDRQRHQRCNRLASMGVQLRRPDNTQSWFLRRSAIWIASQAPAMDKAMVTARPSTFTSMRRG